MKPLISILFAVADESKELIQKSIRSVQAQTEKRFELLIVVDRPERKDIITWLQSISKKDQRIKIILQSEPRGLASSLNLGLDTARAPFCARFDADDICFPERFKTQLTYMRAHPAVDFLFSGAITIDEDEKETGILMPQREKLTNLKRHLFSEPTLIHPTLFTRTKVLRAYRYDPTCKRSQDFELWMRTISKSNFDCIEKPLIYYRIPNTNVLKRINKLRMWNTSARRITSLHRRVYRTNMWYWIFCAKIGFYRFVYLLPDSILVYLLKINDAIHGARKQP